MAGAGVVPDGLDALSLFAAGRVVAGGCMGTEGSESPALTGDDQLGLSQAGLS